MVAARILIGTSGWHYKRTADFVYVRGHGPGGRYRGTTAAQRSCGGPGASARGSGEAAMSMSISTMTRRAQHRPTR